MREIHVAICGNDAAAGSREAPYRTISKAAREAMPGDKIVVHEGEYREWVSPERGGSDENSRITYLAAPGETVVIKGSERIQSWEWVEGTVWKVTLPQDFFGDFNPYRELLGGDWFVSPKENFLHLGEVFLNGKAFREARTLEEVISPVMLTEGVESFWPKRGPLRYPEDTLFRWYTCSDGDSTVIYANFRGANPNEELAEITVRKSCFYPNKTGRNYITVRGFEMAQAACPWTPPTSDQIGLLGANWSKGWIMEDNIIHDAKCSGISIGKEASIGHNEYTNTCRKSGYQFQLETVFRAKQIGWTKENIGSHVIRNNTIYDCGQNGIVGHLGCAFSEISHNHIYNIAVKKDFFGHEIAGIKLHAAIDVQIHHNNISHCSLGTWLDWQAQGTRLSKNLYYGNECDLFVEVTHGPYIVDNNIFADDFVNYNEAQGGAFLHNLYCGTMQRQTVMHRATPYHFPHSTEVAGYAFVYSGDDRLYQNIFLGGKELENEFMSCGTESYTGAPKSLEDYTQQIAAMTGGNEGRFLQLKQPAYIGGNAYLDGAKGAAQEQDAFYGTIPSRAAVVEEADGSVWLEIQVQQELLEWETKVYQTADLTPPRIVAAPFEAPDGTPIFWDTDYLDKPRGEHPTAGPLEELCSGFNRIRVW